MTQDPLNLNGMNRRSIEYHIARARKMRSNTMADLAKQGGRIAAGRLAIVAHAVADWLDGHAEQRRTA